MNKTCLNIVMLLSLFGCCPENILDKGVREQLSAMFGPLEDWQQDTEVKYHQLRDSSGAVYRTTNKVIKDANPYGYPGDLKKDWPEPKQLEESALEEAIKVEAPELYSQVFGPGQQCEVKQNQSFMDKLLEHYPNIAMVGAEALGKYDLDPKRLKRSFQIHDDCSVENQFQGITFNPAKEVKRLVQDSDKSLSGEALDKAVEEKLEGLCSDTATIGYRFCISTAAKLPSYQSYCHSDNVEANKENYLKLHRACSEAYQVLYGRCKNARCFAVPSSIIDGLDLKMF